MFFFSITNEKNVALCLWYVTLIFGGSEIMFLYLIPFVMFSARTNYALLYYKWRCMKRHNTDYKNHDAIPLSAK